MSERKKRILKIISIVAVFLVIQTAFAWAFKPISSAHWVKNDIKTYKNDVDTLIFGSSHVFCGFDPELFDRETGCVSFNLGTASQGVKDAYYYLYNSRMTFPKVKNVIVDVYFANFIKKEHSDGEEMQRKIVLLERLDNPAVRAHYIFSSFEIDDLPWAFFNSFYSKDKKQFAIHNIKAKLDPAYRHCDPNNPHLDRPYKGRGFMPRNEEERSDLGFPREAELNYNIDKETVDYLYKIITFCKRRNINLFFVQMPMSCQARGDVAGYRNFFGKEVKKIAEENDIPYEDFNDSKYNFSDDLHFASSEHLNPQGAELATKYCAEIINEYNTKNT